jgi:hypothetical protein
LNIIRRKHEKTTATSTQREPESFKIMHSDRAITTCEPFTITATEYHRQPLRKNIMQLAACSILQNEKKDKHMKT